MSKYSTKTNLISAACFVVSLTSVHHRRSTPLNSLSLSSFNFNSRFLFPFCFQQKLARKLAEIEGDFVFLMAGSNEINANEAKKVVPLHTWILISNFKLAYNMLRRPDGTFNRELAEFLDRKVSANTVPVDGVYSFDVVDRTTNLVNRVYRHTSPESISGEQLGAGILELEKPLSSTEVVPVILFFHGGSFTHSSANSAIYDTFCRRLTGLIQGVVVSVNYRRSPEHRYPCAYEDGWEALKWVHSRSWLVSGKDSKVHVYLAGDSSGGNIAHHVAHRAAISGVEVLGNILLHPLFGGEERTESEKQLDGKYFVKLQDRDWYWRAFLPEGKNRDHPACNIFGPRGGSLAGIKFPKSLVVVAGFDLVQDWQLAYVAGTAVRGLNLFEGPWNKNACLSLFINLSVVLHAGSGVFSSFLLLHRVKWRRGCGLMENAQKPKNVQNAG